MRSAWTLARVYEISAPTPVARVRVAGEAPQDRSKIQLRRVGRSVTGKEQPGRARWREWFVRVVVYGA